MSTLARLLNWQDKLSEFVGKTVSWMCLVMIAVLLFEITARYVLNKPTEWAHESSTMLYGTFCILGGVYTHLHNGHVRSEVIYQLFSPRGRAFLDALTGFLGLLIFGVFFFVALDFAIDSWKISEHSSRSTWALLTVGTVFAYFLWGPGGLELLAISSFASMDNFLLVALPMFIFMGLMLEKSGITDALFGMISTLLSGVPGGLGVGTIIICALIAAMAGVSGAATVSLGIIALPAMLKRGYDKKLVTGTIMAGGALGFLIPPSVLMILYAYLAKESVGTQFRRTGYYHALRGIGSGFILEEFTEDNALSPYAAITTMLVIYFLLGMFLDDFAIVFIPSIPRIPRRSGRGGIGMLYI